jgi:hypothetical protein
MGLERTALCADKIAAILKPRISSKALPIYECAAAQAQAVGQPLSSLSHLMHFTLCSRNGKAVQYRSKLNRQRGEGA